MKNPEILIGGLVGTTTSAVGTATQTNETLQTISLIITIVGAIISIIVVPLLNWYIKAKADGKITKEEIDEGIETIKNGVDGVKEATQGAKDKNQDKSKEDK